MGGRGSSSGIGGGVAAFDIDMGGGSRSHFVVRNGKTYRETGDVKCYNKVVTEVANKI